MFYLVENYNIADLTHKVAHIECQWVLVRIAKTRLVHESILVCVPQTSIRMWQQAQYDNIYWVTLNLSVADGLTNAAVNSMVALPLI